MKKILAIGAAAAMMLAGCASNQPAEPQQPAPEPEPIQLIDTSVANVRITYSDEQVASALKAMNVRLVKEGKFPKLVFQLVNFTQAKLPVEYKVQWLDGDGAPFSRPLPGFKPP